MSSSICCNCYEDNDCIDQDESLLEHLNDLRNQLKNISIYQIRFIENVKQWCIQAQQLIQQFPKEKSDQCFILKQEEEEVDYLLDTLDLLIKNNCNKNEDYFDCIKQLIQSIKQNLDEFLNIRYEFCSLEMDQSIICDGSPNEDRNHSPFVLSNLFSSSSFQTCIDSNSSPSSLKDPMCHSKEEYSYHFRLSAGTSFYPYLKCAFKRLNILCDNWYTLSANERYLLAIGKCDIYLFNRHFQIVNQKSFFHRGIKDIFWSKTLDRFIFVSPKQIYTFDEKTMILHPYKIYFNINSPWERGTCSERNLFLSTFGQNPSIIEFNFNPSIQFNKKYQSELISHENEFINDIKYNNSNLAIIIEDGLINQTRFELRSLNKFQCIWIISLGQGWGYRSSHLFNQAYWIITDYYNQRIIHILKHGTINKIENYYLKPFNIVQWGQHQIVIRTIKTLNIHQCE